MNKIKEKINKYDFIFPYLGIAIILFLAGFNKIGNFGLYSDDWGAGTYFHSQNIIEAMKQWVIHSGEMYNFRPLAILLPIFWYLGYILFGLVGVFLVIYLLQIIATYLIYFIFKNLFGKYFAFFGALLFILFPTQSFYLWQVASSYFLALIFVLLAIIAWQKKSFWFSAILILFSLLINESVFGIYFLSIIPKEWTGWKKWTQEMKLWAYKVFLILPIYILARIIYEKFWLIDGGRAFSITENLNILSYLTQFIKTLYLNLFLAIPIAGWKIWHGISSINLIYIIFISLVVFLSFYIIKNNEPTTKNKKVKHIIWLGLILILMGRYYGFYYVPSINILNLDSRHYFASSIGAALIITVILYWLYNLNLFGRRFSVIFSIVLIIFLCTYKISLQTDYSQAWLEAKKIIPFIFENTKISDNSGLIIINLPTRKLGTIVSAGEAIGDLRITIPRIYGINYYGVSSNYLQKIIRLNKQICIYSSPYYNNLCFDQDKVIWFEWDGEQINLLTNFTSDKNLLNIKNEKEFSQILKLIN